MGAFNLKLAVLAVAMAWTSCSMAENAELVETNNRCAPPALSSLQVSLRPQQTEMWCWAASGQMVMEYLGKSVAQCVQANKQFQRSDCCNSPVPRECIFGGWPQFHNYGFTFQTTHDAELPWAIIQAQLAPRDASGDCKFTPFAFTWHWKDGGGHMMVAKGYKIVNNVRWIEVENPLPVDNGTNQTITYDEYVSGDDHTHWDDYYDVK